MYIYESHTGRLYVMDIMLDYDDLYCEQCGDSDMLIGYAETKEEAWNLLENLCTVNDSGRYSYDYIQKFLKCWDNIEE